MIEIAGWEETGGGSRVTEEAKRHVKTSSMLRESNIVKGFASCHIDTRHVWDERKKKKSVTRIRRAALSKDLTLLSRTTSSRQWQKQEIAQLEPCIMDRHGQRSVCVRGYRRMQWRMSVETSDLECCTCHLTTQLITGVHKNVEAKTSTERLIIQASVRCLWRYFDVVWQYCFDVAVS